MSNIKVVIGSNFGDEGKGLATEYFAQTDTLVVLSNGGAQRGHTVDTLDGKHHTFHHFGSGTFKDAHTLCSKDFILNPMTFRTEYADLKTIINIDKLKFYIDTECQWSTPYDMIVNQIVEEVRDGKKHGSCGMGIWETVDRYRQLKMPTLIEFNNMPFEKKVEYLKTLRDTYFTNRLHTYNIKSLPSDIWKEIYYSDILIIHFIDDVQFMLSKVIPTNASILKAYNNIVFENGQGLLLDQNNEFYDENSTTPSNTGAFNAIQYIKKAGLLNTSDIELCYVSRSYMTRHGNGLFVTECDKNNISKNLNDTNNITNPFQGKLRYGELDVDRLVTRVNNDSMAYKAFNNIRTSIMMTHINEKAIDSERIKQQINGDVYLSDSKYSIGVAIG